MWFNQPRFTTRDAESRTFWTIPSPAPVQKIYRVFFFSKYGLVAPSEAGDMHFLRLRHQFLAKRFGGFWSGQKPAGSGGSGSDSGSAFLFATVGGIGSLTFRK